MLNDRIYVNGHFKVSPSTSSSYRSSSSSSYNASSSSHHSHSSNHSPSPLPSRRICFNKDKSNSPSSERLNSSFNRGKDGIFRPKSLMSLATEIDYTSHRTHHSSSPSSSSYSSSSALSSNPRLAQFRSHHREGSVPRQIISTSVDTGGYTSPRSRTYTLDSSFYSNFNDNLSYLSSSSNNSSSAYSSSRHRGTTSSSTSSYLPSSSTSISSSPYQSYRFTNAYYAPKLRERPLLSNLRLKFAPTSSISNNSRPSHSSINSSRTTSVSSNHLPSPSNSVSSSEAAAGNQNNPRLERNKFLIKFREHNNASPRSSGRRRSSISWDIPGETTFPKPSSQVAESLEETIQEVETPQPQVNSHDEGGKELWKMADTPAPQPAEELLPSTADAESDHAKSAITSVDENNNNLTRWNGSLALNKCSMENTEILQSGSPVSLPPPPLPPASPSPVPETRHSVTMPEQCDLALSVRVRQASEQSQPLTATAAVFDLTTSSGENEQSKQTLPAVEKVATAAAEEENRKPASESQQLLQQHPELMPEVPAVAAVKVEKIKKKKKVVESKLIIANEKKSEEKARGEITDTALTDGQSAKVVGDQTEEKVINSGSRLDKANAVIPPPQQPVINKEHKTKSEKTTVKKDAEKAKSGDVIAPDSITPPVVKTKVLRAKTGPIAKIKAEPEAIGDTKALTTKVTQQSQVISDEPKSLPKSLQEKSNETKSLLPPEKVAESKPKSKIDEKIVSQTKESLTDTKESPEKVPITKPKSKIETKEAKALPETEKAKVVQPKSKIELKNAKENQVISIEEKPVTKEKPTETKPLSIEPEKVTKPKSKLEKSEIKVADQNQVDVNKTKGTLKEKEKSLPLPEQTVTIPKNKIENADTKIAKQVDFKESNVVSKVQPKEEKRLPSVKPELEKPEKVLKPKSKTLENENKVVKSSQIDLQATKILLKDQAKQLEPEKVVTAKPKSNVPENEIKVVKESQIDSQTTKILPKDQVKQLEPEKIVTTKPKSKSETDSKAVSKQKKDVIQEKSLPTTSKIELSNEQPKETNKTLPEISKPEKIVQKSLTETNIVKPKATPIEQTPTPSTEAEKKLEKPVKKEPKIELKIEKPKKSKDLSESEKIKDALSPPVSSNKSALKALVVPEIKEIRSPSPEPPVVTVKLPPKNAIAKAKSTEEKRPLDAAAKLPAEPVIKHAKTVTFAADQSSTKELPKSDATVKTDISKPKVVKKKEVSKKKAEVENKPAPVTDSTTEKQNELTKTNTEAHVEQPKKRRSKKKLRFREYTVDDFTFLAVLGRGSFGKVLLAEVKGHNVCFAVKCLKKQTIIEDDDVESIMIERKVLAFGSSNPFICKLFCTFQTESHLFFAMELCSGGDLMFHVQKEGKFSEEKSRFYACEILCALWFMHKRSIIYRDLKLDNIMIYQDGHIRLVDFGMCQGKMYREELLPCNFCGTPEYMAPEIVQGVKYNHSVDYWALGVVIYEMVVGTSPFHGTDEDELLWNVCHQDVHYPRFLSDNVRDLIVLLLKRNPNERLGIDTTLGNIESQAWFAGVNWRRYEECKMQPPFVPELNNETDVSYFDRYFTKEKPVISSTASSPISEKDQLMFEGFNYTNHNMTI